ncbi:MAG TPA: NAD(P)H-binding protein [Vicinamibacterales bacterium]|nr:NAD(P)H-binding protein [Vicinamibacterales bacterium]
MPIDQRPFLPDKSGGTGARQNLFALGATGRTGRHVTDQAIARGHRVTAMVRRPQSLNPHARLNIVIGDPLNADDLAKTLPGHHAVISCLGQRSSTDATLLQDAAKALVRAMGRTAMRRCVVLSQGLLFPSRNPMIGLFRMMLARHVADSTAMERVLQESSIDWTIVRPPYLKDGGTKRGYRAEVGVAPAGAWSMQRCDLATFFWMKWRATGIHGWWWASPPHRCEPDDSMNGSRGD